MSEKTKCPECVDNCVCGGNKLKFKQKLDTDWYGVLEYYKCSCCKETFVSQSGGELETAVR